jgi:hypothetical protein
VGVEVLGDFVGIARGGDAGADTEELADARLADQMAHGAAEEGPVGAGHAADGGDVGAYRVTEHPVGRVVVLSAEPIVVDTRLVSDARVDLGRQSGGGLSLAVRHNGSLQQAANGRRPVPQIFLAQDMPGERPACG